MYQVGVYVSDSNDKIASILALLGIFVNSEGKKELNALVRKVFKNIEVPYALNFYTESEKVPEFKSKMNEILKEKNYLKTSFTTKADINQMKKALKHAILWQIIFQNYLGSADSKFILRQKVKNDPDCSRFVGESNPGIAEVPAFSSSHLILRTMGYNHLSNKYLSDKEKEEVIESFIPFIDFLEAYYAKNPEEKTSSESPNNSFHRLISDLLSKEDISHVYGSILYKS